MFQSILRFFGLQTIPDAPASNPVDRVKAVFADPRFTWRSIEALHSASGFASVADTRALVLSLGARQSELAREVYTLPTIGASIPTADPETAIQDAFADSRFTWRSIEALSKASGLSVDQTRTLLANMGARRNSGDKEVYTLN